MTRKMQIGTSRGVWGAIALVALCMGCGGDATTDGAGAGGTSSGTGGAGGQGGVGEPSSICMALCAQPELFCAGANTENGTVTFSEPTATGCTATVEMVSSGTFVLTVDCVSGETCMTAGASGCFGTPGECLATDFTASSLSYWIEGCTNGSLHCWDH